VRDSLYFAYAEFQRAVRKGRYKLIEYVTGGRHSATQLFDLIADPREMTDLAQEPRLAATLDDLRRELRRLRDAWDDAPSEWGQRFWSGYDATRTQA
jgi:arylsulfatase A-like enzyme